MTLEEFVMRGQAAQKAVDDVIAAHHRTKIFTLNNVEYQPLAEFPDFEVSTVGVVRRIADGKIMRVSRVRSGRGVYSVVELWGPGWRVRRGIASLVARTFIGPPPPGHRVGFRNGAGRDCRVWNLFWEPWAKRLASWAPKGESHPNARLLVEQASCIRDSSESAEKLGEKYGVSVSNVKAIKKRRRWKNAP